MTCKLARLYSLRPHFRLFVGAMVKLATRQVMPDCDNNGQKGVRLQEKSPQSCRALNFRSCLGQYLLKPVLILLAVAGGSMWAQAEEIKVTVVAGHPPVFRWVEMIHKVFEPEVIKGLEGTGFDIKFSNQFSGSIAGVGEELETVGGGLAEIGVCQALFDPAKLSLQNITYYTPFVSSDIRLISDMVGDIQRENLEMIAAMTRNNVVFLGAPVIIDDYQLFTNFPVRSLEDIKGHKIAAPGAAINWLSGTGAVGVSGNLTTYYSEMQTGVYDGVLAFATAAHSGKLYEVAPYVTKINLGVQSAASLCANRDWYEGLDAIVRQVLIQAADKTEVWYVENLDAEIKEAYRVMKQEGVAIFEAPEEMRRQWVQGMDNIAMNWARELDQKGLKASSTLGAYMHDLRARGAKPLRNWDQE